MLKKAGIVAALVLTMSSGVFAAKDTVIEETWKQQIPTAHLQYEKGHGTVEGWAGTARRMDEQWNATGLKYDNAGASFGYGLMDNLEVRGFVNGENNGEVTAKNYMGNVKGQIYDKNGLTVALGGSVAYSDLNGFGYGIDGYANKIINDKLTMYHSVNVNGGGSVKSNNGLQYTMNDRHTMKLAVNTGYDFNQGGIAVTVDGALKSKVSEKTNNLLQVSGAKGAVAMRNILESQLTPTFMVRGIADMAVANEHVSGNVEMGMEKQVGVATFKVGVGHDINPADGWNSLTVGAGVDVDVTKNLELKVGAAYTKHTHAHPEAPVANDPSVSVALSYEL